MKKIILLLSIITTHFVVTAQDKQLAKNNDIWLFNLSKVALSEKWGFENELHMRLAEWGETKQQFLIRPSISYTLNEFVTFHLGYTHLQNYPYGNQSISTRTPENNVWAQVTLNHKIGSLGISHRYRLEERWIGKATGDVANPIDGAAHGNRIRYRLTLKKELSNGKNYIAVFDEIWYKFGENAGLNRFNQNWLYVGLGQHLNDQLALELGYMWQVIEKADGIRLESNNTIQFTIHYKLQYKTKKK